MPRTIHLLGNLPEILCSLWFIDVLFFVFPHRFFMCTSRYVEYIHNSSTASTAQHSAITPAQSTKPSTCRSEYVSQYVRTCMRRPGCFNGAWSSPHLQVACLHLIFWTIHYKLLSFRSILLCELAQRAEPPATRSALYNISYSYFTCNIIYRPVNIPVVG